MVRDSGETATLRVSTQGNETRLRAGRTCVVGRGPESDIVMANVQVSRSHLVIEPARNGWSVRDVSSNGTWANGEKVATRMVRGRTSFRLGAPTGPEVVVDAQAPSAEAPTAELATLLHDSPERVPGPGGPGRPGGSATSGGSGIPEARTPGSRKAMIESPSAAEAKNAPGRAALEYERHNVHQLFDGTTSIGRSADNDITVADLLVSRRHAELHVGDAGIEIVDVGSANGTFLNGRRVTQESLKESDVVAVGHHLFQLRGNTLVEAVDKGDATFEAQGLSVSVGGKQLLHDVSFRLPARSLLAVIGPSGAGKSTLLGAITGFRPADTGCVRYAGRDVYAEYDELRRRIGYVPQEDLLHSALTVRKALEYGAELRFPPDVSADERRTRIDEVLAELGLTAHANTQVSRLSGGQRKRTSVAMELLTRPSLLYLDEPTSGLDAGLDKSVMMSLRKLADGGRTVAVVTHSVAHLDSCDYVMVLAPGGHVAYFGPPRGALPYFGKPDFSDVFLELEASSGADAGARFRASNLYVATSVTAPSARAAPAELAGLRQQSVFAQLSTLFRRALSVTTSDRSYLRLIIAFPVLLGLVPRGVRARHDLGVVPGQSNLDAPTVLLVLVVCACLMGTANAVHEIVKERAIYRREQTIGLSTTAYLSSKIVILALITGVQSVILTLIALLGRAPAHGAVIDSPWPEVLLAVAVAALGSAMLGLVISAVVDKAEKAMPLLVLITMTQLVLCGGMVPVVGRPGLEQASWLAPARWGFAALASTTDLNVVSRNVVDGDSRWNHAAATYAGNLMFGLVVAAGAVVLCAYILRRTETRLLRRAARRSGRLRKSH
ncbi:MULTISPECIES: ATP-binding cassette domain-containing protein [unclassified Frankia]|uniref:ATP-binding cassette domain-containing protein n=1 Tax=unclassified Frankia TaxID=2632575 RepID=UPI002AD4429B|nr:MULTISPECIES: ATP-binding cassette domain-containing protein [unclassified Frankia]